MSFIRNLQPLSKHVFFADLSNEPIGSMGIVALVYIHYDNISQEEVDRVNSWVDEYHDRLPVWNGDKITEERIKIGGSSTALSFTDLDTAALFKLCWETSQ